MRRLAAAFVVLFASTVAAAAAPITYTAVLTGAAEDPPNVSLGTGTATVTIDIVAHTLDVSASRGPGDVNDRLPVGRPGRHEFAF